MAEIPLAVAKAQCRRSFSRLGALCTKKSLSRGVSAREDAPQWGFQRSMIRESARHSKDVFAMEIKEAALPL